MKNNLPQLENGYLRISNEIYDALCCFRIPGEVRQIIDCVMRKTYGFGKKEDQISVWELTKMTGMKHQNVSRSLQKAISHKLIIQKSHSLAINKNYNEWISFSSASKVMQGSKKKLRLPASEVMLKKSDLPHHNRCENGIISDAKAASEVMRYNIQYTKDIPLDREKKGAMGNPKSYSDNMSSELQQEFQNLLAKMLRNEPGTIEAHQDWPQWKQDLFSSWVSLNWAQGEGVWQ